MPMRVILLPKKVMLLPKRDIVAYGAMLMSCATYGDIFMPKMDANYLWSYVAS